MKNIESMEEQAKKVSNILKLMSNENRLLILCNLIKDEKTVNELCACLPNITQSAISQHLAILKSGNLIDSKKNAQSVIYFIADNGIKKIMETLNEQYCS